MSGVTSTPTPGARDRAGTQVNQRYQKEPNVVARKVANELILVPIRNRAEDGACIFTLNTVGARIWGLLDGKRGTAEIVETIVQEYEVEPPQAEEDLVNFLGQLEAIGLVVGTPEDK